MELTRRVPHLQQKENSTKITNQIPLNNKPDCCFPSPILKLFKDISSETPILTLLEAVQKKKTELPYKKGSYQKEHNENHFIIFLKKVSTWRLENVSTTYYQFGNNDSHRDISLIYPSFAGGRFLC